MASKPLAGMDDPEDPAPFPSPPWDPPPPYPELRFDGAELRFFFCNAHERREQRGRAERRRQGNTVPGRVYDLVQLRQNG